MSTQSLDIYKGLATYFLPDGVLDYFDIVDFAESPVSKCENKIYLKELHLYLDECDNRTSDMQSTTGNGFTEEKLILDFPIRGSKTILHVRRRRWLDKDGKSFIVPLEKVVQVSFPKTRYTKDFAIFLKMADGQWTSNSLFTGKNIHDQ